MNLRRGVFIAIAGALAGMAACDSFSDGEPASDSSEDGGADGEDSPSSPGDVVVPDAPPDGAPIGTPDSCEVLVGQPYAIADATVTALAADGLNVYWCNTTGATRQSTSNAGGSPEPVFRALGACTDVALGDFVAGRFMNNQLRVLSKTDLAADAAVPEESSSCVGVDPRNASSFFSRRTSGVFTCALGTTGCAPVLDRNNVTSIVTAPAGFDFMALNGSKMGVYHCEGTCKGPDASAELIGTTSDAFSTKVVSDETFVYFLDRTLGILRKVPRKGGAAVDVITGLVEPIDVAFDLSERVVVATAGSGVFRGPKSGCVAKVPPGATNVTAMAVFANTVWYAEGVAIKRVDP